MIEKALLDKHRQAESRIELLRTYIEKSRLAEERRRETERSQEMAGHWQAIDQLRRSPTEENARAAKRAFRLLAMRLHPDQGGGHEEFIRLRQLYDHARAAWQRRVASP